MVRFVDHIAVASYIPFAAHIDPACTEDPPASGPFV